MVSFHTFRLYRLAFHMLFKILFYVALFRRGVAPAFFPVLADKPFIPVGISLEQILAGYNWDAIWGITTLVSIGLMLGFALFFREDGNLRKLEGR